MTVIPAVPLNALREYNFVTSPLENIRREGQFGLSLQLTFHKNLPITRYYKKGAESRRQPALSAGE